VKSQRSQLTYRATPSREAMARNTRSRTPG
jgi:hypothetical protein